MVGPWTWKKHKVLIRIYGEDGSWLLQARLQVFKRTPFGMRLIASEHAGQGTIELMLPKGTYLFRGIPDESINYYYAQAEEYVSIEGEAKIRFVLPLKYRK